MSMEVPDSAAATADVAWTASWKPLDLSNEAIAKKDQILEAYRKEAKPAKPDMQAYKKLKGEALNITGHAPGVAVGDVFANRGELAILGLHRRIPQGIDGSADTLGAFAICLSGGYKDDEDEGTTFWYTGQGGNEKGLQIKDQIWEKGNQALRISCDKRLPVRVIRGSKKDGKLQYVYDGLYMVKEFKMTPSVQGPVVIKFLMEGVPGESRASIQVKFNCMFNRWAGSVRSMFGRRLASDESDAQEEGEGGGKRRRRAQQKPSGAKKCGSSDSAAEKEARLREIRSLKGLLVEDISGGLERLPIPVVNELSDRGPPEDLTYIKDYVFAPCVEQLVSPLLAEEDRRLLQFTGGTRCGLAFNRWMVQQDAGLPSFEERPECNKRTEVDNYTREGYLKITDFLGLHECGESCTNKACLVNKQVTNGISLPLEVFMTADRGWGVRCADDIPPGKFVAAYIGEIITEPMEALAKDKDEYLFNLAHFTTQIFRRREEIPEDFAGMPAHQFPPTPPKDISDRLTARINEVKASKEAARALGEQEDQPPSEGGDKAAALDSGPSRATEVSETLPPGLVPAADAVVAVRIYPADQAHKAGAATGGADGLKASEGEEARGVPRLVEEEEEGRAQIGGGDGEAGHLAEEAEALARSLTLPTGEGYDEDRELLIVDAMRKANVARFINHSCSPNLSIQPVFARKARNLFLYYVALFADKRIPAGQELTYSYGTDMTHVKSCRCGAENCVSKTSVDPSEEPAGEALAGEAGGS